MNEVKWFGQCNLEFTPWRFSDYSSHITILYSVFQIEGFMDSLVDIESAHVVSQKQAQNIPEDYTQLIVNWHQLNRRNSQLSTTDTHSNPSNWLVKVLCHAIGRYNSYIIWNLNETPLLFEYPNGPIYNQIGEKTVWVKESKSERNNWQAGLVFYIFADIFIIYQ